MAKVIELKELGKKGDEVDLYLNYKELIELIVKRPLDAQTGIGIDEMRKSIKILDDLNTAEGNEFKLSDENYELLKQKVNKFKWNVPHKNILQFIDDINESKPE